MKNTKKILLIIV